MKTTGIIILTYIIYFLNLTCLFGQVNLVPNPSFEEYYICPNNISQIYKVADWYVTRDSPDYYNACSLDTFFNGQYIVNVPQNSFGFRTAASGNGYAGVITSWQGIESRENIGIQLISSLQIGVRYYATFKVSLAGQANPSTYCGTNKLGILFSTMLYDSLSPSPICSNCAQISSDSIVTDTLNWTRLTGSFVADSNYSFISVGRFNLNQLTDFTQVNRSGYNAYYYIDDVCLSTDSVYSNNYVWTGVTDLTNEELIAFYPNPVYDYITIENKEVYERDLKIYSTSGEIMLQHQLGSYEKYVLDLSGMPKGIYYLILFNKAHDRVINKLIKL